MHRLTRTPCLVRARSPFRPACLLPILLALALASSACTSSSSPVTVRPPAVGGSPNSGAFRSYVSGSMKTRGRSG